MGTVWDRATEFLSDNVAVIAPLALFAIFLPTSVQSNIAPIVENGNAASMIGLRIVGVLLSIVSLFGQLAIIALAIDPDRTTGVATRLARARLVPVVVAALLVLIAMLMLAVPVVAMLAASGVDLAALAEASASGQAPVMPPMSATTAWGIAGYGLVAAGLLLWGSARLSLLYPVILEERGSLRAFRRSFALTRGLAWPIIGVLLLYVVVSTVAALAAKTVFGSVLVLVAGRGGPLGVANVLTAIIVAAVSAGFSVLGAAFTAKLYVATRAVAGEAAGAA
ncbi:MAG: hypothetical protein B7Y45_12600 [Sphingomonas sp. 28-66-16]|nr:MAG: hypothetical protein B7Y45_12600 [Sphingomonas sp. 28-66-16]